MRKTETRGGWLSEEPLCWVLLTLVLGANSGFLFGFNGVRAALDGNPTGMVVIMCGSAALSCWCVCSALIELWRRWRGR